MIFDELCKFFKEVDFEVSFDQVEEGGSLGVSLLGLGLGGGRASAHESLLGELEGGFLLPLHSPYLLLFFLHRPVLTSCWRILLKVFFII